MNIKPGDIIKTNRYAHGSFTGCMMLIKSIQEDVEPEHQTIHGVRVKKNGAIGKQSMIIKHQQIKNV